MNSVVTTVKEKFAQVDDLKHLATDVLVRCQRAGASQAEVGVNHDRGINVNVRMGDVETIENTRDRSLSITVYFGKRKGSASTADFSSTSIAATVDYACAIARYTEEDSASGLADPERLARDFPDLDLWHPWNLSAEQAINLGIACEQAGRELDPRISNSDGASINSGEGVSVYANSHGFMGAERGTRHSISCALIAENDQGMQRDHAYTIARREQDLEKPEIVGQQAAQRTLQRLGARQLSTRQSAVLFAPEIARSLIGHFISAVSGGALYRRSSFLLDHLGKRIFPQWFSLREASHILRGHGSCVFDAEGVKTGDSDLVSDGILQRYVLGSYSARKLGLSSTANAGGIHNLIVGHGDQNLKTLLREMGTGLWVTDTMGQGVSIITGDYSRGASGFWVENGEIQFPVEEVTIAGNLRDMYAGIQAVGNDLDYRSQILTGSLWIDRMTVAGA